MGGAQNTMTIESAWGRCFRIPELEAGPVTETKGVYRIAIRDVRRFAGLFGARLESPYVIRAAFDKHCSIRTGAPKARGDGTAITPDYALAG
jgi:hypothetical protein